MLETLQDKLGLGVIPVVMAMQGRTMYHRGQHADAILLLTNV